MATQRSRQAARNFPRDPNFDIDLSTEAGALQYALFYTEHVGNVVGACLLDHPGDKALIDDMHTIIGSLAAVRNTLQLLALREQRARREGTKEPICPSTSAPTS